MHIFYSHILHTFFFLLDSLTIPVTYAIFIESLCCTARDIQTESNTLFGKNNALFGIFLKKFACFL